MTLDANVKDGDPQMTTNEGGGTMTIKRVRSNAPIPTSHTGELLAPVHDDATPFRYELRLSTGDRAYTDTVAECLQVLIPGYAGDPRSAAPQRYQHATAVRTTVQAELLSAARWEGVVFSEGELETVQDPIGAPVAEWTSVCPLVIIDIDFEFERTPKISAPIGNVIVLRPLRPHAYLMSLAEAGWVGLAEHS